MPLFNPGRHTLVLALLVSPQAFCAQSDQSLQDGIVGTWKCRYEANDANSIQKYNADGTYENQGKVGTMSGTWSVVDGKMVKHAINSAFKDTKPITLTEFVQLTSSNKLVFPGLDGDEVCQR